MMHDLIHDLEAFVYMRNWINAGLVVMMGLIVLSIVFDR